MSWDRAAERNRQANEESSKLFIRLVQDGQKFVGAFLGDPHIREIVRNPITGQGEDFTDAHRQAGLRPTPRYKINVYLRDEGVVKIWELNRQTFDDLLDLRQKYGLENWYFEVKRNGTKNNPNTKYIILPDTEIDATQKQRLRAMTLHDLARTTASEASTPRNGARASSTTPAMPTAPSQPCIDVDTARVLVERLKKLPRPRADAFLARFAIARIRDLTSSNLPAALHLIEQYEAIEAAPIPPPPALPTVAAPSEFDEPPDPFGEDEDRGYL